MKPSFYVGGPTRGIQTKSSGQGNQLRINMNKNCMIFNQNRIFYFFYLNWNSLDFI